MKNYVLAASLFLISSCSTTPPIVDNGETAPPEVIAETLYNLTKGYSGNFEEFISTFASDATYQGNVVEESRDAWEKGFDGPQSWEFSNIKIYHNNAFVWFTERGDNYCAGPALYKFNSFGLIKSVEAACAQTDPNDELPEGIDPAVVGQAADIVTTGVSLAAGLVEGNPLLAGIGFPAAIALKFGVAKKAGTLPPQKCHDMKTGLSTAGWMAAVLNACMPTGAAMPICVAAVAIVGKVAYEKTSKGNAMQCWKQLEGSDAFYQKISAEGINK